MIYGATTTFDVYRCRIIVRAVRAKENEKVKKEVR